MTGKDQQLENIQNENSRAFRRIESLYLALNDLEAFEREVLAGGKNCPEPKTLRRPIQPVLNPSHAK
jgi:hypothetical protein